MLNMKLTNFQSYKINDWDYIWIISNEASNKDYYNKCWLLPH